MKAKMIIKINNTVSYETVKRLKTNLIEQWNYDGIVVTSQGVDIQAIILEDEKGEIKVINLKNESVKTRKKVFEKIKKVFHIKNKG